MKKFFAFLLVLPMLAFCDEPITPDPEPGPDTEVKDSTVTPTPTPETPAPEPEDELAPEVKSGDVILVTNASVQKFLTDVSYPERDYSYSDMKAWATENGVQISPGKNNAGATDTPPAYTLRWEADAADGEIVAKLAEPSWSREWTLAAGETHLEIRNLCPNTHYTFEVKAGDKVLTEGEFDTYGKVRQVRYHNVRNCRDLGGWPTKDGHSVRYRMIYRSGRVCDPYLVKVQGVEDFKADGIRGQLDLRGTDGLMTKDESPLADFYAMDEFEFLGPGLSDASTLRKDAEKARVCYQFIIDCVLADMPVVYHCSLGRDRTGMITTVLLGLLGVHEGLISQDYELTQFAPSGYATSSGETVKCYRNADYPNAANFVWKFVEEGETFADGAEKFLLSVGISQEDIDAFRETMIVDAYPDLTPAN